MRAEGSIQKHNNLLCNHFKSAFGFLNAIAVWLTGASVMWLIGGLLLVLVIPFTLIVIFPTNKKLLDPSLDKNSDLARQLLTRWAIPLSGDYF